MKIEKLGNIESLLQPKHQIILIEHKLLGEYGIYLASAMFLTQWPHPILKYTSLVTLNLSKSK
jgi:hypothetical protein